MLSKYAAAKGLKPGLYGITDSTLTPPDSLLSAVEQALKGGLSLLQYREKKLPSIEQFKQAADLAHLCTDYRVPLIINDDPELAKRVKAEGVHLGQGDRTASEARRLLGEEAIIGITCHGRLDFAQKAVAASADYVAFGRFFNSSTKPGAPLADPKILSEAQALNVPVAAIGGITLANAAGLIQAGADLLAVVAGLFGGDSDTICTQARSFNQLFAKHHPLFTL